jgi:hypothetical protein
MLLHSVQTGSGVNRQGGEADHSLSSSAEVKNGGAIPPNPIYLPAHLIEHRNKFLLLLLLLFLLLRITMPILLEIFSVSLKQFHRFY